MNYYFTEEHFTDGLIEEIKPLTELSWREANCAPETVYAPDWDKYTMLNDKDYLRLFTVRTILESKLIGYATFIVSETLHSSNVVHAMHDSLFIYKPHRKNGTAKKLIEFIEGEFALNGVDTMVMSVMTHRDYSNTLKQLGFKHSESNYIKRLA